MLLKTGEEEGLQRRDCLFFCEEVIIVGWIKDGVVAVD